MEVIRRKGRSTRMSPFSYGPAALRQRGIVRSTVIREAVVLTHLIKP